MTILTHSQAQGLIQHAADRSLSAQQRASLDSHMVSCSACRSYSNQLNQLRSDLGSLLRDRWNRATPNLSSEAILRRSRTTARRNNLVHMVSTVGMMAAVLTIVLLADAFLNRPITSPASPVQNATETAVPTGMATATEEAGSTYLDQVNITSPFPPPGIGEICPNTSTSPIGGKRILTWPTNDHNLAGKDFSETHPAIDLSGATGDPVRAAYEGVAIMAGWNTWGYGNLVILDHGHGLYTLYGHLDSISVSCGQYVNQGEMIGAIGMSGNTTTPELHFQVLSGSSFINPKNVLPASGECEKVKYKVQEAETLSSIADRFGVSVTSIEAENNRWTNYIFIGEELTIPLCNLCKNIQYIVQEGDTLYQIANLFNVTPDSIYNENQFKKNKDNIAMLTPGMALTIPLCHN